MVKMQLFSLLKKHIVFIFLLLIISLAIFSPSFDLAFDGDSYLTLLRYKEIVGLNNSSITKQLNYLLTDYGPQDTMFATLYKIFNFNPVPFYIVSYLFRVLAAFSFYPLIFHLTKKRFPSYFTSLFFVVATAGIETTNWVFNMPSYIAIFLLNFFLLHFLKNNKLELKQLLITPFFFIITILSQPIRMIFLPLYSAFLSLYLLIKNKNLNIFIYQIFFIFLSIILIFLYTDVGGRFLDERISISKNLDRHLGSLKEEVEKKNYTIFLFPIGQAGKIILPQNLLPKLLPKNVTNQKDNRAILFLLVATYIGFIVYLKKHLKLKPFSIVFSLAASLVWTVFVFLKFSLNTPYPFSLPNLIALVLGGFFLITSGLCYISSKNKKDLQIGLVLSTFLVFFSFFAPWVRYPTFIQDTVNRYLIVGAAGFSIFLGIFLALFERIRPGILLLSSLLLLLNAVSTYQYLAHLSKVRGIQTTQKIRHSLPILEVLRQKDKPVVFYFETDNPEVLYHALTFGLPVILAYQQEVANPWNIVPLIDWNEVVSAHLTGKPLERFGTSNKDPVGIEYIYSFSLKGNQLIDTTEQTRKKLLSLQNGKK